VRNLTHVVGPGQRHEREPERNMTRYRLPGMVDEDDAFDELVDDELDDRPTADVDSVGLWATLLVLARRWPILVLGVNLTLGAGVAVVRTIPLSYSASGALLINVPPEPAHGDELYGRNPYLGTRSFVGDLLITIMEYPDAANRVADNGGTGTYKTTLALGDAALVQLDATGRTSEEALATWTAAANEAQSVLERLQRSRDVPDSLRITVEPLSRSVETRTDAGGRVRVLIATLVLGVAGTVLTVFTVESRSRTRHPRDPDPDPSPPARDASGPDEPQVTDPDEAWWYAADPAETRRGAADPGVVAPRRLV
jgi:hypothetical protein